MSQEQQRPGSPTRAPQEPQNAPVNAQLLNEIQSEVSSEAAPLLDFLMRHGISIMAGLALFVAVLLGYGAYTWYDTSKTEEAQLELSRIVLANVGEKRIEALETFSKTAPESINMSTLLALAETAASMQNYSLAATYFGKIVNADPDGPIGTMAALNQGQALILAKKYGDAAPVLEGLLSRVVDNQRNVVRNALAEALLLMGDTAKAKQLFEAMANESQGAEADFYRYRAKTVDQYAQKTNKDQQPAQK